MKRGASKKTRVYGTKVYLNKEEDRLFTEMKLYYGTNGSALIRTALELFYRERYLPRITKEENSHDS